jgi:predicted helicase
VGQDVAHVCRHRGSSAVTCRDRSGQQVEWVIDRYYVRTDKASGIVNDPNDWSREHEQPRYVIDLLERVVTVSLATMMIVDALPPLDILDDQKAR